ncbi:MAG: RNA polymerase sigma factor [Luteolibacter sp.]
MKSPATSSNLELENVLRDNLAEFLGFARWRTGNDQLAADAVQESLLRALKAEETLTHEENLRAWFYRILRNVLTDLHRREASRQRAMREFAYEFGHDLPPELEDTVCRCLNSLIPALKPEYGEVLQRVELDGEPLEDVADSLGISRGNLNVRLHRGRRQLRERLEQTCRICATHGCLDCTCNPNQTRP